MRLIRLTAVAILTLLVPAAALAQDFSSLEERMTYSEFKAAGLDKLTEAELAALNAWLRNRAPVTPSSQVAGQSQGDRRGFAESPATTDAIKSRILGAFKGWEGTSSEFVLENGMVWKSSDPSARLAVNLTDPMVTLTPGFLGAWYLRVEGYNQQVRVKRIE